MVAAYFIRNVVILISLPAALPIAFDRLATKAICCGNHDEDIDFAWGGWGHDWLELESIDSGA